MNDNPDRKKVIIDGGKFSNLREFYAEMETVFLVDDEMRIRSLDAFNEALGGGFGVFDAGEPLEICWLRSDKSREELGYEATEAYYAGLLERCRPAARERILLRMEEAAEKRGETLMDIIVRIILENEYSGHDCTLVLE